MNGRLAEARRLYEHACSAWHRARENGDLVLETDEREKALGVKWRAATPAGAMALGTFEIRKAELDAAAEYARNAARPSEPDRRLPPERDAGEDDAA